MPVAQGVVERRTRPHNQQNKNIFQQQQINQGGYNAVQRMPQPTPQYGNPYGIEQMNNPYLQPPPSPYSQHQQLPNYTSPSPHLQQQPPQLIQQNPNMQSPQLIQQQSRQPTNQISPIQSTIPPQQLTIMLETRIVDLETEIKQLKEKFELQQLTIHQLQQSQQHSQQNTTNQETTNNLQIQIDTLKDTVLKLQTYTMEVNKQLLETKQPIIENEVDFETPKTIILSS
jgi:hypothetical protein